MTMTSEKDQPKATIAEAIRVTKAKAAERAKASGAKGPEPSPQPKETPTNA